MSGNASRSDLHPWLPQGGGGQEPGQEQNEFIEFYTAHLDDCLRVLTASTGDPRLAEELVAEGFARAWASWGKVRRHPAPHAWVVRVALNVHVSRWRRRRREVALDGQDVAVPASEDLEVDPALLDALRKLPRRQREVVGLRVLMDLDTKTTARMLGISVGAVGAHFSRAKSSLREDFRTGSGGVRERCASPLRRDVE